MDFYGFISGLFSLIFTPLPDPNGVCGLWVNVPRATCQWLRAIYPDMTLAASRGALTVEGTYRMHFGDLIASTLTRDWSTNVRPSTSGVGQTDPITFHIEMWLSARSDLWDLARMWPQCNSSDSWELGLIQGDSHYRRMEKISDYTWWLITWSWRDPA